MCNCKCKWRDASSWFAVCATAADDQFVLECWQCFESGLDFFSFSSLALLWVDLHFHFDLSLSLSIFLSHLPNAYDVSTHSVLLLLMFCLCVWLLLLPLFFTLFAFLSWRSTKWKCISLVLALLFYFSYFCFFLLCCLLCLLVLVWIASSRTELLCGTTVRLSSRNWSFLYNVKKMQLMIKRFKSTTSFLKWLKVI